MSAEATVDADLDAEFAARFAAEMASEAERRIEAGGGESDDDLSSEFAARFAAELAEEAGRRAEAKTPESAGPPDAEFIARFAAEVAEEIERRVESESAAVRSMVRKALAEIKEWRAQVDRRVMEVENRPPQIVKTEVEVREAAAPRRARPKTWSLRVMSSDGGLMRTVLAEADTGATMTFTISRTPDGFPKTITATA
jgi:hypothetical protein